MDWSGADIGWVGSFHIYEKHPYGKTAYSKDMGCRYSTTYSAIVYRLDRGTYMIRMYQQLYEQLWFEKNLCVTSVKEKRDLVYRFSY